jgi:hypothetical protein
LYQGIDRGEVGRAPTGVKRNAGIGQIRRPRNGVVSPERPKMEVAEGKDGWFRELW